jgi:alanine racemase
MEAFQRATAWIDLGALERNCARLRSELPEEGRLCAVVKANGYGHGMTDVATAALAGGASGLAVAAASEAFELRSRFAEEPILVMGALTGPEIDVALQARAEVAVWQSEVLAAVAAQGESFGVRPRIHVKYDSGMGRLGARDRGAVEGMLAEADADPRVELAGLWTHFATADDPGSEFFGVQLERFDELVVRARERHPGLTVHAANSAATLREPASHYDMVRCGIAIYGLDPFGRDPAEHALEPVMGVSSYVADVKRFRAGDSAGYGRRWRAPGDTWVGVLPIGYGDGVRRGLSDNCEVLIAGRRYPVVGTVSMDNITVDLGPEAEVERGEEAVLLGVRGGERLLAEEWARRLGTINYEITTSISPRVPRMQRR